MRYMKKVIDNKFLLIMILSVSILALLILGVFVFSKGSDTFFVKEGYILNPMSSNDEKYYFNAQVNYKENLSSNIVFEDTSNEEVVVRKDSFVHYTDGDISFLKNGAILDLGTINLNIANYYNVTSKVMIKNNNGAYYINATSGRIDFKNWIGRISENKYIVAGESVALKLSNNDNLVKGNYFEIYYVENGVVNVENQEVKYQIAAEDTYIYVSNNIVISLGDKKIIYNGKDIMSITAITIDGDENIDIIPEEKYKEEQNNDEGINDNKTGTENIGENNNPLPDGSNSIDNNSNGLNGNKEEDDKKEEKDKNVSISIVNANVTATSIGITVNVDSDIKDNKYKMYMTNTNTGKRVYSTEFSGTGEIVLPTKYSLTTDTNYLVTIEDSEKGYFQSIFKTKDLGVSFNELYATSSSLTYNITFDKMSEVDGVTLNLYKYNEKTGEYVLCEDEFGNKYSVNISKDELNNSYNYTFDNLESNTNYTAVIEKFKMNSISYSGIYNISLTNKTLKNVIEESIVPTVTVDNTKNIFSLLLKGIEDKEKSITKYTYYVYDAEDITSGIENPIPVIDPIEKTSSSPVTIEVAPAGTTPEKGKLENGKNYVYKAVIEYYDNEKYGEFETVYSGEFVASGAPIMQLIQDNKKTTYNKIVAKLNLIDNSCTVPLSGRECLDESNEIKIIVTDKTDTVIFNEAVTFEPVAGTKGNFEYELTLNNLIEGSTYRVQVVANKIDMRDGNIIAPYNFIFENGNSILETKKLSSLQSEFKDKGSNKDQVVNSNFKLVAPEIDGNTDEENASYTASSIESVVFKIYKGDVSSNLNDAVVLAQKVITNKDYDLKSLLYGKEASGYDIKMYDTFGLSYDDLVASDNLSEKYTIAVYAYYEDVSIYPNYLSSKEIDIKSNKLVYKVNPLLFITEIEDPVSVYNPITNKSSEYLFENISDNTIVGFNISSKFHKTGLEANEQIPKTATYYVYRLNEDNTLTKVDFYVLNGDNLEKIDKDQGLTLSSMPDSDSDGNAVLSTNIYMEKGTDLNTIDDVMRRGNRYFVSCEIKLENNSIYPYNEKNTDKPYAGLYGIFLDLEDKTSKELPSYTLYADHSDENSITYKYTLTDNDKTLVKDESKYKVYYKINELEEKSLVLNEKENNKFEGTLTIPTLNNDDSYELYLKENTSKISENSNVSLGKYIFDGNYNIEDYNNNFEIINRSDNSVKIKVLMEGSFLERILSYKLVLTDSKGNNKTYYIPDLVTCGDDDTDSYNRCIIVDYKELKDAGMQTTDISNPNNIKVSLVGFYDTGNIKWVKSAESNEYYIFQENITEAKGNYYVFSKAGKLALYYPNQPNLNVKTHYTYNFDDNTGRIKVKNAYGGYNLTGTYDFKYEYTANGILNKTDGKALYNSKVVKEGNIKSSNDSFSFSSITPKISTKNIESIINGANITMNITGFDEESFKKQDDKYYFYVDVWENEEDALGYKNHWNNVPDIEKNTAIKRTVKYEYDPSSGSEFTVLIDGLMAETTYYYTLSAYMKDGRYTQFFDGNVESSYDTAVYKFKTSGPTMFQNLQTTYSSSYNVEGENTTVKRTLDSSITLVGTDENLNFGLKYVICDSDSEVCDLDNHIENLVKEETAAQKVKSSIELPSDFVYGKNYKYKLYGIYDVKDQDGAIINKGSLLLNPSMVSMVMKPLTEPTFTITRKASIVDGEYVIDLGIKLTDPDKTIENGTYKLNIGSGDASALDNMSLQIKNGSEWVDKDNNIITITDDKVDIRIKNLKEATSYIVGVTATSKRNNDGFTEEEKISEITKTHEVYSTNSYGIAFGDVLIATTSSSVVAKFWGGSSFESVSKIDYQISLKEDGNIYIGGSYDPKEKPFLATSEDESTWRYIIDPEELLTNPNFSKNGKLLEKTFKVRLKFYVTEEDNYVEIYDTGERTTFYEEDKK